MLAVLVLLREGVLSIMSNEYIFGLAQLPKRVNLPRFGVVPGAAASL